jgi:diadenosine tetraphosphate (Ap4A) HIT family hydrolase
MLGNVLPELHVHVIARRFDDDYFPKPVFGLPGEPYSAEEADALIQKIKELL